jgi:hypothetical protein
MIKIKIFLIVVLLTALSVAGCCSTRNPDDFQDYTPWWANEAVLVSV